MDFIFLESTNKLQNRLDACDREIKMLQDKLETREEKIKSLEIDIEGLRKEQKTFLENMRELNRHNNRNMERVYKGLLFVNKKVNEYNEKVSEKQEYFERILLKKASSSIEDKMSSNISLESLCLSDVNIADSSSNEIIGRSSDIFLSNCLEND